MRNIDCRRIRHYPLAYRKTSYNGKTDVRIVFPSIDKLQPLRKFFDATIDSEHKTTEDYEISYNYIDRDNDTAEDSDNYDVVMEKFDKDFFRIIKEISPKVYDVTWEGKQERRKIKVTSSADVNISETPTIVKVNA